MAKEPDNVVLRILQEIQKTQGDQGLMLAEHSRAVTKLKLGQDEIRESIVKVLGRGIHSKARHDMTSDRLSKLEDAVSSLDNLRARVSRLEATRGLNV